MDNLVDECSFKRLSCLTDLNTFDRKFIQKNDENVIGNKEGLSLKPLINAATLNTLKFCTELSVKCSFNHNWVNFSNTVKNIFQKYNNLPSIFPGMCQACQAVKFGLLQKNKKTILNSCSIPQYLNTDTEEGPYLQAFDKTNMKSQIIFKENTIIIPCGYLLTDMFTMNSINLFHYKPNKVPVYSVENVQYFINPFLYEYFKTIYLKYSSQSNANISFINKILNQNSNVDQLQFICVYESEIILLGGLIRPTVRHSLFTNGKQNNEFITFEIKEMKYIQNPIDLIKDQMEPEELIDEFSDLLHYVTKSDRAYHGNFFKELTSNVARRISAFCVPNKITVSKDENSGVIRQYQSNVIWKSNIGLVATRDITNGELLTGETSLSLDEFKNLKLIRKNNVMF